MNETKESITRTLNVSDKIISNFLDQLSLEDDLSDIANNLRQILLSDTTISEKNIRKAMFQDEGV